MLLFIYLFNKYLLFFNYHNDEWSNKHKYNWFGGFIDGCINGWMDGWIDVWLDRQIEMQAGKQAGRWWGQRSKHHTNCYWSVVYNTLHVYIGLLHTSRETKFHSLNCHIYFKFQSDHSDNHNLKLTHSLNNWRRKSMWSQQPVTELHSKSYKSCLYPRIFVTDTG